MNVLRIAIAAIVGLASAPAFAGLCDDPGRTHQSAIINVGAAATTKIIDGQPSGVSHVAVCSIFATLAGTTPTVKILYGTRASADCDTGATSLTGTLAPASGSYIPMGDGGDLFTVLGTQQICATTTGTGSSFQGVMTYVRK